jgi:phage-related protein
MSPKSPDYWKTRSLKSLEEFKEDFSKALKVALDEGQDKEANIYRVCISQVQAQIDELRAEKPTE